MVDSEIKQWDEIKEDFQGADILLGNGFSICLNSKFQYNRLFETFINGLDDYYSGLFNKFGKRNFEEILTLLVRAVKIDALFNIPYDPVQQTIDILKTGLINAIHLNHPRKEKLDQDQLERFKKQLSHFSNIYTLNYDSILYNIILRVNDDYKNGDSKYRYGDFFWGDCYSGYKEFRNFQDYPDYRNIFYLHGALFLVDFFFPTRKITKSWKDNEFLDTLAMTIQKGNIPLFISEGESGTKLRRIFRNEYLSFAYKNFYFSKKNLVIFGSSLAPQDEHITRAIRKSRRDKIALSVYTHEQSEESIQKEIYKYKGLFVGKDIKFFNSSTLFN